MLEAGEALKNLRELTKELNKLKKAYDSATTSDGLKQKGKHFKEESNAVSEYAKTLKNKLGGVAGFIGSKIKTALISAFSFDNMVKMSQYASDYMETLNLFEVSLGKVEDAYGNLDKASSEYYMKAIKFQNTLEEKLGVNKKQTMEYQALFNQMSKSMGIADQYAYMLSENFTKLGLDLSSLFNIDEETAMSKLRAGLAGQTKPLRDLGLDITQQSLAPIAQELGLEKSIKQMSQAEKMCLRYIAVLRQTTAAQGDMAKTVESQANQMRIFNNQLYMLKANVGAFFSGLLTNILPYINGIMMALNALIKTLAGLFGIQMKAVNGVSKVSAGVADDLGTANDNAKKLKAQLMGFDEIHNITLNNDTGSGSGVAGGGIDQRILDAMKEYDNLMADVDMKATGIRDKIMEWLGFTKEINPETGEVSWHLNDGFTNLEKIGVILGTLGILIGLNKVLKVIGLIVNSPLLKFIKSIFTLVSKIKGLGAIAEAGKHAKETTSAFSALSAVSAPLIAVLAIIALVVMGVVWALKNFENIKEWFSGLSDVQKLLAAFLVYLNPITGSIATITLAIKGLQYLFENGWDATVEKVKEIFAGIGETFKGAFEEIGENIKTFFTEKIPEAWTTFTEWLGEKWEDFTKWLSELPGKIGYFLGHLLGTIVKFFIKDVPAKLKEFGEIIGKFFTETLPQKWEDFKKWVAELPEKIQKKLEEIGKNIGEFFTKTLPEKWDEFWKWIQELPGKLLEMGKNIVQGLIDGINSMLENIGKAISDFCGGFVQGFKDALGIHSPSTVMKEIGTFLIEGLKNGILDNPITNTISTFVGNIKTGFENSLSTFKTIGSNIVGGIKSGIQGAKSSLQSTVNNIGSTISGGLKNFLGIHSPSRLMRDEIGKFIPLGIAEGIDDETKSIYESISDIKDGILDKAQSVGFDVSSFVDYGDITGSISTQTETSINTGFMREFATQVVSALRQNPLEVNIEAKTEEGVIVKKASEGFTEYYTQNGELPFPT